MSYRNFRKIDSNRYDIEEYRVDREDSYDHLTDIIAKGRNALGPIPKTSLLNVVDIEISPGELIDRYTILFVKLLRMPNKAHIIYREIEYLSDKRNDLVRKYPDIKSKEDDLIRLNEIAWDNNEILINMYSDPDIGSDDDLHHRKNLMNGNKIVRAFGKAHRANQQRIVIKNEINEICNSDVLNEPKSYN